MGHVDVDKAHNSCLKPVLGSFHHDDKFLLHLWPNFNGNTFLKFLGDWILNKPAVELYLRILDESPILVAKWQLLPVVLAEDGVTSIILLLGNVHSYDLVFAAYIAQKKG
jgi:hypothetical protein